MRKVICVESEDGPAPDETAGRQVGDVANGGGPDPGETAGGPGGEIVSEDGPVRDEGDCREVFRPRILQ